MNAFTYTHRTAARFMAVLAVFSLLMSMVPMQAFAVVSASPYGDSPVSTVNVCHFDASDAYKSSGNLNVSAALSGHNDHEFDIIAPFYHQKNKNSPVEFFAGLNWNGWDTTAPAGFETQNPQDIWSECVGPIVAPKSIDLSVTKVANDTTPDEAQTVVYTIVVSNAGPDTASNVVLTDNVPAGTTFVSATPAQSGSGPYTWNLGTIAKNTSKTVTVTVTVDADTRGDVITNTASAVATETDSNPGNNSASEVVTVNTPAPAPKGKLTIKKDTNDASGDAIAFNFTGGLGAFSVNGDNTDAEVFASVTPGQYTITESDIADWSFGGVSCTGTDAWGGASHGVTVTIADKDDVTCTFTNTKDPVDDTTITINKVTNVVSTDKFAFYIGDSATAAATLAGGESSGAIVVAPGFYGVSEDAAEGWTLTGVSCVNEAQQSVGSEDGSYYVELAAGDDITCTFTNTKDVPPGNGTIIVDKVTVPAADAQSFTFTTTGTGYTGFSLTDEAAANSQVLVEGTYSVAETAVAGWTQTNVACVSSIQDVEIASALELDANETITCTFTNTKDTTPVEPCELTVVSNITNAVDGNPAVLAWVHRDWMQQISGSFAEWIWGTEFVSEPAATTTQTFTKTFTWNGPVTEATLRVAADNSYVVKVNGVQFGAGDGFAAADVHDMTAFLQTNIVSGTNTLEIVATNWSWSTENPKENPAGLIYDLNIVGNTSDDCKVVPDDGGGDDEEDKLSCELTASDTSFRRGGDATLTWNILNLMTEGVDAVLTNSVDDEEVDIATETGSREEENIGQDTTYTLTVYGDYLENSESEERESITCSVSIDTTTGGGGGRRAPRGDVAGDSTSKPEGKVLGEQVSVVPLGAADAGAGSTSPIAIPSFGLGAAAFIGRSRK